MNEPDLNSLFRVDVASFRSARAALARRHPQMLALIEAQKKDYSKISGLTRLALLIATTVWRREHDPACCPRCGMALHEPPTREELKALDERD